MPPPIEIIGKYIRERHRFANDDGDVIIGDIDWQPGEGNDAANGRPDGSADMPAHGKVPIKGPARSGELIAGIQYRWRGRWAKYRDEQQFAFQSFTALAPIDRESVVAYLATHGAGHGLGKVRAAKLWEEFGQDAVRIARTEPKRVSEYLSSVGYRYKLEHAEQLSLTLVADQATEAIKLDLITLLGGRGFPKSIVDLTIQTWGNRGAEIIRRNPYKLLQFAGYGFKRCDAMYLDLGLDPSRLKRQALCAWYSLEQNNDGHTWFGWKVPAAFLKANIASAGVDFNRAVELGIRGGILDELRTAGESGPINQGWDVRWFADAGKARNERDIASVIVRAKAEKICDEVVYATIEKFDGYRFSSIGGVESCWTNGGKKSGKWKQLKTDETKGYLRVTLRVGPMEYQRIQISHLILQAFFGDRPLDAVACHWDGNTKNNSIYNLRWDTRKANEEDKKRHNTHQTGSMNPAAKITEADATRIRELYETGDFSTYDLSRQFHLSRPVICKIVKHELWKHVP